jgi:hypothetical protein
MSKCAPTKKYTDGSCFTIESLKLIAENYNKINKDKINISNNKEKLVKELENKLTECHKNQSCWLKLDIVKELENKEINENTLRPEGPNKKYEWLSTTHINDVVSQYQEKYNDFLFLGAVPYDFEELPIGINNINFSDLEKKNKTKLGMVINLDEHDKSGSHWVALYTDLKKNQVYFFDSFGKKPGKKIKKFINKIISYLYYKKYNNNIKIGGMLSDIKKLTDKNIRAELKNQLFNKLTGFDIRYNTKQHQFGNSECGVYSINFILRLIKGDETFDDITNNITKDDKINECRKEYFVNT